MLCYGFHTNIMEHTVKSKKTDAYSQLLFFCANMDYYLYLGAILQRILATQQGAACRRAEVPSMYHGSVFRTDNIPTWVSTVVFIMEYLLCGVG
jgi:hypothetical protein